MAVNRIQANGTAPSPDRPDFNIAAGTGITITASDDATNQVSKATISTGPNVSAQHYLATSAGTVTVAAGTGAGTSPTVTIIAGSNDTRGIISVLTGSTPAGSNATVATVTFGTAFAAAPYVVATPCNAAAAALSGTTACFVDSASTAAGSFVLKSGSAALTGATTYLFLYEVTG